MLRVHFSVWTKAILQLIGLSVGAFVLSFGIHAAIAAYTLPTQNPPNGNVAVTLDSVTDAGAATANSLTVGGLISNGNLIQNGSELNARQTAKDHFYLNSYRGIQLRIDDDNNSTETFAINNGANNSVLTLDESGNLVASGDVTVGGTIRGLPSTPTNPDEATSKEYVDTRVGAAGGGGGSEIFTSDGTWTRPAGVYTVNVIIVGGGGGGGGSSGPDSSGASGGDGETSYFNLVGAAGGSGGSGGVISSPNATGGSGGSGGAQTLFGYFDTQTWGGASGGAGKGYNQYQAEDGDKIDSFGEFGNGGARGTGASAGGGGAGGFGDANVVTAEKGDGINGGNGGKGYGAGGGGSARWWADWYDAGGGGGGSGSVVHVRGMPVTKSTYNVYVGLGGSGGAEGKNTSPVNFGGDGAPGVVIISW